MDFHTFDVLKKNYALITLDMSIVTFVRSKHIN